MRVVFLRAYAADSPYQWSMPPLGIGYLLAVLKQGLPRDEFAFAMSLEQALDAQPDLVAISSASENFTAAQQIARRLRQERGINVIVGGAHITALPHTLPDCFAAGVLGEGEPVIVNLVEALRDGKARAEALRRIPGIAYHDGGRVAVTGPRRHVENLDDLPFPDREALGDGWAVPRSQQVHLISSRGCPYDCSFCASARGASRFRRFSPEYVAREIEWLRRQYDPEEIYFFDDLFIADRAHFREVCRLIRERGLHEGVIFRSYGRANLIDAEILDLVEACNFLFLDFGFESNCEKTLRYLNKTGVTPQINQRALDLIRGRNISVGASLIIGSPDETREDIRESYDFVVRNRDVIDRMSVGPLLPIPGTRVWAEALERGLVAETMDDWSRVGYPGAAWDPARYPLLSRTLTAGELQTALREFLTLQDAINAEGRIREFERRRQAAARYARRLKSELDAIKGSRLARWALKARDWKQRVMPR